MTSSRSWILFAVCSLGWLILSLTIAPSMNGTDVFIFRDAGWNLAARGSFESAGLIYMQDLVPRFYSHYTPAMPLLFAGFASIFPRNAYAGTIFNELLGILAASVALYWTLRQPRTRLRTFAVLAIAVLPVAFVTYDRPEALALVFFTCTIAFAARPNPRPVLVGLFLALTFLAHPFVAATAAVWASSLALANNWNLARRWLTSFWQIAVMGVTAITVLIPVALLYHFLDPDSLARFAKHALGYNSGLGVALSSGSHASFLQKVHRAVLAGGSFSVEMYFLSLVPAVAIAVWAVAKRKQLGAAEYLAIAAALSCEAIAFILFPTQMNYLYFLAFALPVGLLVVGCARKQLATPALALLLFIVCAHLPLIGVSVAERVEERSSFQAAQMQPLFLRDNLPSPDAIVAVEGGSYDLYKPQFRHLIELDNARDIHDLSKVAAIANCYGGLLDGPRNVAPLPPVLVASQFHMIQPDPQHLWISLKGHRILKGQWGYGCDLYLRNNK